ncbi:hypothetical protein BDN72DRAFT_876368 [Pluteus cervinus]|uniref:Uncharacterized protein n=1 Tax=Pluteus cervinus TaxID=181527 RepID=A0ACD3B3M6_9AGAR|nr:hypothetical protein BDN72DRAFT_876368 [Pluteus cervinus]
MPIQNVEEERLKIDSRIHKLRLKIADLCSERNTLSPIFHFPAELMAIIFGYARDFSAVKSRSKTVMTISWVCRRWRYTSLDLPHLWSDIDFDHSKGIKKFLTRSKNTPLSLWLSLDHIETSLFNHSKRFRSFNHIPRQRRFLSRSRLDLDDHWWSSSPNLECLSLTDAEVPAGLSLTPVPLRELSLTNCVIWDWNIDIFSKHLTTFSLTSLPDLQLVVNFLQVLSDTPALKFLTLDRIFEVTSEPSPFMFYVELPALEVLKVRERAAAPIHEVLDHFLIPGNATATFTIDPDLHETVDSSRILASYRAARTNLPTLTWMSIKRESILFGIDTVEEFPSSQDAAQVKTTLAAHILGSLNPLHLSPNLDLTSLRTFHLSHSDTGCGDRRNAIKPDDWRVFGSLPHLEAIKMAEEAAFHFLAFLAHEGKKVKADYTNVLPRSWRPKPTIEGSTSGEAHAESTPASQEQSEPQELAFKTLREVILDFPSFDDYDGEEGFPHNRIDYRNLLINLMIRKGLGFRLTRLEYHSWPVSERNLKILEWAIEEVEDGDT